MDRDDVREALAVLACCLGALALRLYRLDDAILGGDELHLLDVVTTRSAREVLATAGEYDFSIPLAFVYRLLAEVVPLSERMLRAPFVACGALLPLAGWFATRRFLSRGSGGGAVAVAAALAAHPLAIYYGRFARPYGIVLLLLLFALGLVDRALAGERVRRRLALAALATGLATWINLPAALPFAALWAGALVAGGRRFGSVAAAGLGGFGLAALAYLPALPALRAELVGGKLAKGELTRGALEDSARVLAGTPSLALAGVLFLLALAGACMAPVRWRARAALWLAPAFLVPLAVLALRPRLLEYDLALPRYLFGVLPAGLVFAVLAVERAFTAIGGARRAAPSFAPWIGPALAAAWVALGPYGSIYAAERAYAHHVFFQRYGHLRDENWPPVPLAAEVALRDAPEVVVWPPAKGFRENRYPAFQESVGRPLRLLVADERPFASPLLALRRVVRLDAVDSADSVGGDLPAGAAIVLCKDLAGAHAARATDGVPLRKVALRSAREHLAIRSRLERALGKAAYEDVFFVVFRVRGRS